MQEGMGHSREMEILKKNPKEMLETKKILIEMKNAPDDLTSRLHMAEKRMPLTILLVDYTWLKKESLSFEEILIEDTKT